MVVADRADREASVEAVEAAAAVSFTTLPCPALRARRPSRSVMVALPEALVEVAVLVMTQYSTRILRAVAATEEALRPVALVELPTEAVAVDRALVKAERVATGLAALAVMAITAPLHTEPVAVVEMRRTVVTVRRPRAETAATELLIPSAEARPTMAVVAVVESTTASLVTKVTAALVEAERAAQMTAAETAPAA